MPDTGRSPFSRLWTIEYRAGPAHVPVYQGRGRALSPSWDLGDRTPVREPDPERYGAYKIVDAIKGERGLPTLPIEVRYMFTASEFLSMARRGCLLDLQVHFGKCKDPSDFNGGFDKVLVLEAADMSSWGASDLGAFDGGQDAVINEAIDLNGYDLYEVLPLRLTEIAPAAITNRIEGVVICDSVQCGACGVPSSGCQVIFAIQLGESGSPGAAAELIFSDDGGATIGQTIVTTLSHVYDPEGLACVGRHLAIISRQAGQAAVPPLHYALLADILTGTEVWTAAPISAFVAAGAPLAIYALDSAHVWIVGQIGYVYFSDDITLGVVIQDLHTATDENLYDVHAYDEDNVVAVGANGAVIYTRNGGGAWVAATTSPHADQDLKAVWMHGKDEWFVGDIGGQLWYTRDGGETWVEKTFPGSGAGLGTVHDIVFATPTVGYMAHSKEPSHEGRILRTIDGGHSWYVLPEGPGAIAANRYIESVAAVPECPNVVYGGGLGGAVDGILVKGEATGP